MKLRGLSTWLMVVDREYSSWATGAIMDFFNRDITSVKDIGIWWALFMKMTGSFILGGNVLALLGVKNGKWVYPEKISWKTNKITLRSLPGLIHQTSWAFYLHPYSLERRPAKLECGQWSRGFSWDRIRQPSLRGTPVIKHAAPSMLVIWGGKPQARSKQ